MDLSHRPHPGATFGCRPAPWSGHSTARRMTSNECGDRFAALPAKRPESGPESSRRTTLRNAPLTRRRRGPRGSCGDRIPERPRRSSSMAGTRRVARPRRGVEPRRRWSFPAFRKAMTRGALPRLCGRSKGSAIPEECKCRTCLDSNRRPLPGGCVRCNGTSSRSVPASSCRDMIRTVWSILTAFDGGLSPHSGSIRRSGSIRIAPAAPSVPGLLHGLALRWSDRTFLAYDRRAGSAPAARTPNGPAGTIMASSPTAA